MKKTVLSTWAAYLDCPEVATSAINFAAIDWPAEQASRGRVGRWEGSRFAVAAWPAAQLQPAIPNGACTRAAELTWLQRAVDLT